MRRDGTLVISLHGASGSAYGTWDIQGNRFTGEIGRSSLDWFPPGSSWSDVILELSETDLVLRAEGGVLEQYRRIAN